MAPTRRFWKKFHPVFLGLDVLSCLKAEDSCCAQGKGVGETGAAGDGGKAGAAGGARIAIGHGHSLVLVAGGLAAGAARAWRG